MATWQNAQALAYTQRLLLSTFCTVLPFADFGSGSPHSSNLLQSAGCAA